MNNDKTFVLLVCKKDKTCDVLRQTVESLDFNVEICASAQEAKNLFAEKKRDIVISEYELSDSNGIDLLKSVQEQDHTCTRILVGHEANEEIIIKSVIKGIACTYFSDELTGELIKKKLEDIARIRSGISRSKLITMMPANEFPINMTVYEQLMDAINNDRPLPEIAHIVEKDVTLTTKVLQVANSAFYGNFTGTSIEKAIIYMGLNPIKDIVLLHSLAANLNMNAAQNKELEEIVRHSILTNYYMHAIAKKAGNCPITALNNSVGIIHDIGKLVQLVYFPMEYNSIDEYREENPSTDYYTCEMDTGNANIKHSEIGAYFLRCWNFNQYSIEAALYHHEPEQASDEMKPCIEALFLGNTLADIRDGFNLSLDEALARCEKIKLPVSDIMTILPPF